MYTSHRKHPLSIAISLSLLAVAATSGALVSSRADASSLEGYDTVRTVSGTNDSQSKVKADTVKDKQSNAKNAAGKTGTGKNDTDQQPNTLSVVKVVGIRASQMRAIELKRIAPDIQDSITAESIGQLPDVTIADALQRVTGVQINRDAGVGSTVDVRGLPEVGTLMNGEVFISPDQISSQQPDFSTIPASLFNRITVIKSPTASLVGEGISGTLDLHTYRPWDLPSGFTYSYNADGEWGQRVQDWGPQATGLISYNDHGRWGLLLSANVSDTTRENANEGLDQYGVVLNGENAASADGYNGFLTPWNGAPIPSQIKQFPNGSVDVNGDGKSNGVFMGSQDISLYDVTTQRRRRAFNGSFQADLGGGFTLTSDFFFTRQDQYDRNAGIQFNSTNWQGATYVPLVSQDTGRPIAGAYRTPEPGWEGMQLFTTQVYKKWPGDTEAFSQIERKDSIAKNFNLQIDFDNGGAFTGQLRGIRETASQSYLETDLNISDSNGDLWPNVLKPGVPASAVAPGAFIYPSQLGGDRIFNANGIPQNTIPIIANFQNRNLGVSMPASMSGNFANVNDWTFKTIESSGNYNRNAGITALSFNGHYNFFNGIRLDFGIRNSIRTADNYGFTFETPVYAGIGASDPGGCLVRYAGADVTMNSGSCTASNPIGYFRAGPLSAVNIAKMPAPVSSNLKEYSDLLGSGITFWNVDPHAMDNPLSYWRSLYPDTVEVETPGRTWAVGLHSAAGYLQGDFSGHVLGMRYAGNVGLRIVNTDLSVTQHRTGAPGSYGDEPVDAGTTVTDRSYRDYLPALNFSLDLTHKLKLRLGYSKNMMPLNLSQWGGGLSLNYSLAETPTGPLFRIAGGSSTGNPDLNPWRSKDYNASLAYYINPTSMVSLAWFKINVQSFIENGSIQNCDLPDEDGVVRHRCVVITEPLQGTGGSIHGLEGDYRQALTFLPGLLADTGFEINGTFAPSSSAQAGADLAGHKIPFQDNSKESGNLILWFQNNRVQARVAYNYRSKRAVSADVGAITGMELYEAPQHYVDASVSYKVSKYADVYLQGSNLTNEYQRFYLVWPSQEGEANFFERSFMVGVRATF